MDWEVRPITYAQTELILTKLEKLQKHVFMFGTRDYFEVVKQFEDFNQGEASRLIHELTHRLIRGQSLSEEELKNLKGMIKEERRCRGRKQGE